MYDILSNSIESYEINMKMNRYTCGRSSIHCLLFRSGILLQRCANYVTQAPSRATATRIPHAHWYVSGPSVLVSAFGTFCPVARLLTDSISMGHMSDSDRKETWTGKKASTSPPGMLNSSDPVEFEESTESWCQHSMPDCMLVLGGHCLL